MMTMLARWSMPLVAMAVAAAAYADEKSPEDILARKGLVPVGSTLLLEDSEAQDEKVDRAVREARQVGGRLAPLLARKQGLDRAIAEAEKVEQRESDSDKRESMRRNIDRLKDERNAFDRQFDPELKRLQEEWR